MYLIDRKGLIQSIGILPVIHPLTVLPIVILIPGNGSRIRRNFAIPRKGICFFESPAIAGMDGILIKFSFFYTRNKTLPNAGAVPARHECVRSVVPAIKIADDRDSLGVGCPDGEYVAPYTIDFDTMAAKFFVQAKMLA